MQFIGIRYFLVPSSGELFDKNLSPKNPSGLFLKPILERRIIELYKRKYTIRIISDDVDSRYLIGYFLKSIDTHVITLDGDEIDEDDILNWEKLILILDQENQIIAIEHKSNIAHHENIKHAISKLTEDYVSRFELELKLEFLIDKAMFWNILDGSDGVFQIGFQLNAPNLFGARKKANEFLGELKEKHNMTKVGIDLQNKNGNLKYNSEELESYVEYSDAGGGNWTLSVLKNGKKKEYKSSNNLRKTKLETDLGEFRSNLEKLREILISVIKDLDDLSN